ncbi:MAG: AAA family ATPase [Firmicutes bacterium]|nr:AAA family ATPase [Bacillota bacterium]
MYIEEKLYEETQSSKEELDFLYLEQYLKKEIVIGQLNIDILKTLKLYNKDGYYNVAGELLSDENDIRFSGIDIVRFGDNINQILHRETLTGISLLQQYDKTIETFERYYQLEEIQEYKRVKKELIPKEAFREALANAIVHRNWDINSYIQIGMYHDRIEVLSPGGLPPGISREDYLTKNISVLKNPIIAGVFYRLNLIEKFGTGIGRIVREYEDSMTKPDFVISQNNISVILPIVQTDMSDLIKEEVTIYNLLKENQELSRQYLDTESGFNKSKTLRIINSLLDKNLIEKQGKGVNTTYSKK